MKILITGGAGFIGSHFTKYMVNKYPEYSFIVFDKLTYAGNLENLKEIADKNNFTLIRGDVCDLNFLTHLLKGVDAVFHLAAESHVDNSLGNSLEFTKSNTYGTHVLLEAAYLNKVKRFIHVSTDEVYGDIEEGSFREESKLSPNNPYSASKAAAEMIARAYYKTYKLPLIITRGNNVYGSHQFPEKIIAKFTCLLLQGKKVPLHGSGNNIRAYIHAEDFAKALDIIFQKGEIGEIYNIGTINEISNIELTKLILRKLGKDESYIDFIEDRPFNDKRYSVDLSKISALGWKPEIDFESGLDKTINWFKENPEWWMKAFKSNKNNSSGNAKSGLSDL